MIAFFVIFVFILFLSTPSGWRATAYKDLQNWMNAISIHALRVEGDRCVRTHLASSIQISIHALRVEGDCKLILLHYYTRISIHALRVEGDLLGATTQNTFKFISIHALRVEGDGFSRVPTFFIR